jgi:DNA-binding NarL/FixJ family response regulator
MTAGMVSPHDGGRLDPTATGGIRVAIVDDHSMVAEGLARIISREADFELVGTAVSVAGAMALIESTAPEVVLMDYGLPDGDGASATEVIVARWPNTKVVLLSGSGEPDLLSRAIEAGCAGYLDKSRPWAEVAAAVRSAASGRPVMRSEDLVALFSRLRSPPERQTRWLTAREMEVLRLMAHGRSTEEIGATLFVALNTVRNHVSSILTKLGAHSKLEAVAIAARDHVISRSDLG